MVRSRILLGLILALPLSAEAAPGRFVSPYSNDAVRRPITAGPLITTTVNDKKAGTFDRGFLDAKQYENIKAGALEIVKRFPPTDYHYVTLGRSPTAIAAFFDNLSSKEGDVHTNIPASGLRDGGTQGLEAAWYAHLDRFLPKHVLEGKQKILLIDRSTTGATLTKVQGIVEQYLAHKGIQKGVQVIAFARAKRAVPIDFIDVSPHRELIDMNRGTYDTLAKYPWFYVGQSDPKTLNVLPAYSNFRHKLRERMSRDAALDQAIADYADYVEGN